MSDISLEVVGQADIVLEVVEDHIEILEVGIPGAPGAPGLNPRGTWSVLTQYHPRDLVLYQGSSYVALTDVLGGVPGVDTAWQLLARKGDPGDVGGSLPWDQITGKPDSFNAAQTAFPGSGNPWVIQHNKNKFPNVVVIDSAGTFVWGEIAYISTDVLEVRFGQPFSGTAFLT